MNYIEYYRDAAAKMETIHRLTADLESSRAAHSLCADALDIAREEIADLRAQLSRARRGLVPLMPEDTDAGFALSRALCASRVPDAYGR